MSERETPQEEIQSWVIGVGASAGGLEALTQFVSNLPAQFSSTIIIAQHLAPHAKSMMVELLQRHTQIPIEVLQDKHRIAPSTIYIAPPNHDIDFDGEQVYLVVAGEETRPKPSVNRFFDALARVFGKRAVGIILSGTGSDGAEGVQSIKASGGMTLAQDDLSAKYDGMPRAAVATGDVDLILTPEQMARDLSKLLRDHSKRSEIIQNDDEGLKKVLKLVKDNHGTDFRQYKSSTIMRRAARRMDSIGVKTFDAYYDVLSRTPGEVAQLAQEMLISVTSFFRDIDAFRSIIEPISKIVSLKQNGEEVRAWVAGCATGEEAYSIAMLFYETMERQRKPLTLKIFATDLDQDALLEARTAFYTDREVENLPEGYLEKFFEKRDGGYEVIKRLKDQLVFARQDMTQNPPFVKLDLVSCRNVLIYFDQELQKKVVETFHYALNANGTLFLGKSEMVPVVSNLFKTVDRITKIYAKLNVPSKNLHHSNQGRTVTAVTQTNRRTIQGPSLAEQSYLALLSAYSFCGVTIDEECTILQVIGDVSGYIGFHSPQPDFRLTNLLPKGVGIEIPLLIRRAIQSGEPQKSRSYKKDRGAKGETFTIALRELAPDDQNANSKRIFVVNFESKKKKEITAATKAASLEGEQASRISELEQELFVTREHLQTVIEELGVSNEELQSTNEELSSTNEELHASGEELETTNEELQSSNEELTTLNEELNAKQSELKFLNVSFENVQNSIGSALIIVDGMGRIVRYNPEALKLFALNLSDVGREIGRVSSNLEIMDFEDMVFSAINEGISSESVVEFGTTIYQLRILPCLDEHRSITGAILIFFNDTDSLRNQEKLAVSDQRMRSVINGSDSLISLKDAFGRYLLVNETFTKFFSLQESDIIGKTDRELFSDGPAVQSREFDVEVLVTRSVRKSRQSLVNSVGEVHHFSTSRFPLLDKTGNQAYAVGTVAIDVTAEVEAQKELEQSQSRYRAIVDDQAVFVVRHDKDGRFTFVNRPFTEHFGAERKYLGQPFDLIVAAGDKKKVHEAIGTISLQAPISQFEHRVELRVEQGAANAPRWVRWIHRGIFDQEGVLQEYQTVGFDVTEMRSRTDELVERDAILSSVFDHTVDFLSVYRVKGNEFFLESFNKTTAQAFGGTSHQMVGRSLKELVSGPHYSEVREKYARCVSTKASQVFDEQIEIPGGIRYFATTLVPIPGENGEVERVAATSRDVSIYKKIENDLRRAKEDADLANKSKSDFLASMSHELRTPLNVVLGMSQLLSDSELTTEQLSYVKSVHRSGRLLLNLIEDVLDVAKIEAGAVTLEAVVFDPIEVLQEALEMFSIQAKEKKIELKIECDFDGQLSVIGDPARLRQIAVNLLSNAVKFTDVGSVTLSINLEFNASQTEANFKFAVTDTGIGIPDDAHKRLFKRFSQIDSGNARRYGGTGLGLMISKQLVTLMGGSIGMLNNKGAGSQFCVIVPFRISKNRAALADAPRVEILRDREIKFTPLKVLAVDDSDDSRSLIGLFLKKLGYEHELASGARDAIMKIGRGDFDIVLMDIQMPEMDGYEVTKLIRTREDGKSKIPIVALTANAMSGDSDRAFTAGMDDYLTKPIDIEGLKDLLLRWGSRLSRVKDLYER